jgi:predicted MFS family arabinose efflux permease
LIPAIVIIEITAGFSLFKIIPLIMPLMNAFGVAQGSMGILNSSTSWASFFLTIPIGFFVRAVRPRYGAVLASAVMILGSFIGMVGGSFPLLVVGRVIEGVGSIALNMTLLSLAMTLATGKNRGTIMGVAIGATMVGQLLHLNIAPRVELLYGWKGVYQYIMVAQAITIVLWFIVCGSHVKISGRQNAEKPTKEQTQAVYKNKSLWLVSIGFTLFMVAVVGFGMYIPSYWISEGMDPVKANSTYSISTILGLFMMVVSGIISDKLKGRIRVILVIAMLGGALSMLLVRFLPLNLVMVFILVYGTLPRPVNPLVQAAMPHLVDNPMNIPIANSLRDTVTGLAMIVSSVVIGFLIQLGGYHLTMIVLAGLLILGAILFANAKDVP